MTFQNISGFIQLPLWKKITICVVLLIGIGIISFFLFFNKQTGFVFDTVKKTTVTEIVSDSGKITSDGKIDVNSPTNGVIEQIYVTNGQTVKEDQDLFRVKSSATAQEQQSALAAYQMAVANQNTAETLLHTYRSSMYTYWKAFTDMATNSTYEKSKGVPNEQARTSAEFQSTQDNWLAAEKQFIDQEQAVSAAQAQVNALWTAYLATQTSVVAAQISGVVNNISVSPGNSVSIPTITNPTPKPILTIVSSSKIEGVLEIGQTDIAKVKTGQEVRIHPDPYKDKEYDAQVIRVDTLGQDTQGVIFYNVYVEFSSTDEILKPGMTLDADIITNTKENVLTVPNSAIVLFQGSKAVRVLKDNKITYIPVKVGIKGETQTQILSGLSQGQQIIVALTNEKAARPSFLGL
ncbi:MAG TPA: efflux RND transporter periplasmic adaptor subunit [Patescibacteria group bacterium]|nr:efflux RND transporter periplasmic adaptor subunit [Patescibacteria group bacterium]